MKSKILAFLFCLSIGLCGADYFRRTAPVLNLVVVPIETCKPVALSNAATLASPLRGVASGETTSAVLTGAGCRLNAATAATSTRLAVVWQQ